MRRFLLILGALTLAIIVVAGIGAGLLIYKGNSLDAESKAFVDTAVPAIAANWNKEQLLDRMTPELRANVRPEDLQALFNTISQLGSLVEYQGATGEANMSYLAGSGSSVSASYVAKVRCKSGTATIQIAILKHDGRTYSRANQRIGRSVSVRTWLLYPAAASATSYTVNAPNQYSAVGSVTPTYDGNGNLTFDGTFTYAYDAENRLTAVKQGSATVATYAYDGRGRRKAKTVGTTTTVYVTDADNREVLEYDGTSGQVGRWYAYGLGSNDVLN